MPTIMTHAIVPLALASVAGRARISPRLALAGAGLAMLPDADVIGFALGIEYADTWGHRGATHAVAFAVIALWRRYPELIPNLLDEVLDGDEHINFGNPNSYYYGSEFD